MNIEQLRTLCIRKKGVTESFPFDNDTLVFKVMGKMFALVSLQEADSVNLKCDPERAIELRAQYPGVIVPGFHMNKSLWNTVRFDGNVPEKLFTELIDHSYELVVAKLTRKDKEALQRKR